jgi:small subunit ribosomal protein S16
MVKIRLRRTGAKKKPSYRVVVAESTSPRDGRFIEIVGHYNPRTEPTTLVVKEDRILYWLSVGAQPTDSVKKLLQNAGTLDRFARFKAGASLEEVLAETPVSSPGNGAPTKTRAQKETPKAGPETEVEETEVPVEA